MRFNKIKNRTFSSSGSNPTDSDSRLLGDECDSVSWILLPCKYLSEVRTLNTVLLVTNEEVTNRMIRLHFSVLSSQQGTLSLLVSALDSV